VELIGKKPERRVVLYFLIAIAAGTILLQLPWATTNESASFTDALFTATSAVCVTGLTVLDTGHDFTRFGQVVILILIQLGGIGILTFTTLVLLSLSSSLHFGERQVVSITIGEIESKQVGSLLRAIVILSLTVELIGAAALFIGFQGRFSAGETVFVAIFHSVSAFCNAGFSTFSNSLEDYRGNIWLILVFSALIVSGGLGFIVIREVLSRVRAQSIRLSLHTRLCLSITAVLLIAGMAAFFVLERTNALEHLNMPQQVTNALFQSVTTRTAGFNSIPQPSLSESSLLLTLVLMFIGGCPGSTAGGIKTTTFAVILLMALYRSTGRSSLNIFNRAVSGDSIRRATTVLLLAIFVVVVSLVVFMLAEGQALPHTVRHGRFLESLFEVVSAFGTVGLSLGMTTQVHVAGKIILIVLMFAGRVGLLTLVFALARPSKRGELVFREEPVMMG
jgi:trk system potassium uptake protein TrkH